MDPIVEALNAVLKLEITACEQFHTQEHVFERWGVEKLASWYDKQVARARIRRRFLLDTIAGMDEIPVTEMGPAAVTDDVAGAYTNTKGLVQQLRKAYSDAIAVTTGTDRDELVTKLRKLRYKVTKIALKVEAQQKLMTEIGPKLYLSMVS